MSAFDGVSLVVNPGRSARVVGAAFELAVERQGPTQLEVALNNISTRVNEDQATAMMRAFAQVLGYEIGARHEC